MKKSLIACVALLSTCLCHAQTKVFKEVIDGISSYFESIRQDNATIGYLLFTTLEKASKDSFNYRITLMDENLNDIGVVNFREQKLHFQSVAFEQDVLCLSYFKSNFVNVEFKSKKEHKEAYENAQSWVFLQFLNLEGKIIETSSVKTEIVYNKNHYSVGPKTYYGSGPQKQAVQVKNIPGKGFACFFREERKNNLLLYDVTGKLTWTKPVKEEADLFGLMTSGTNVYLLMKKKDLLREAGYELLGYSANDFSSFPKYTLKDKKGNSLKVLNFENDPSTGKAYLTGYIINPEKGNKTGSPAKVKKGTYAGLFTINLNGPKKADINEVFSYWNDGSQSFISSKGRLTENKAVPWYVSSFKDYEGNTYFTGSTYVVKPRWGNMAATLITLPTIYIPVSLSAIGYSKAKELAPVVIKQTPKGNITLDNTIQANQQKAGGSGSSSFSSISSRTYYCISNPEKKSQYLIIDDKKDIFVYNIAQKKVVRTIPHKDGDSRINVFPAKEGHVMFSEYNKKEKYTRYSIEAL